MNVVVLGCGFGGVEVARTLRTRASDLEVVMIDRSARFDYQPAYPELLSGKVTPEEISCDLQTFATKIGANFIHAEVLDIDLSAKTVRIKAKPETHERDVHYDFLVLALGAEQTFFGIPGAEAFSHSVNSMEAAMETKHALDQRDSSAGITIQVIGAGLSGVEVAGELVDYFKDRGDAAEICLVEMMPRILPACPHEHLANYVEKFLTARGIEMRTATAVQEVTEHEITFKDGQKRSYDLIIWTAGIKPNTLLDRLDVPKVKGWLIVDHYLRLTGMNDVFAVGDTASFERDGVRSGQNVEEAEAQGKVAAVNIVRTIKGQHLRAYRPKNTIQDPRALISLGDDKAVAYSGKFMFRIFAYRIKKFVEHRYMKRFK